MLEIEKEKYSHSKLKLFEHCPFDYYLRYELGIQAKEKSHHLVLGLAMHKLNESRIHGDITFTAARKQLKDYIYDPKNKSNKTPGEIYKMAEKMAKPLLENKENAKYKVVATEEGFEVEMADFILRGFIDGRTDNDYIYEYKTAGKKYDEAYVKQMWQWVLYRWGFEKITGRTPHGIIYHVSYKNGAKPGVDYLPPIDITDADLDRAKQWILKNVIEIRKGNFEPNKWSCGPRDPICDYKDICQKLSKN